MHTSAPLLVIDKKKTGSQEGIDHATCGDPRKTRSQRSFRRFGDNVSRGDGRRVPRVGPLRWRTAERAHRVACASFLMKN